MKRKIVLAGSSIALAEMLEADQQSFKDWLEDEELRRLIDDMTIPTMEDQMRWFARVQKPDRKFFSLVTVPGGELIGNCGFVAIDDVKKEATLRITIGNPAFRSKGLGSEAIQLMIRYAFDTAGWKRLTLKVLADNERAIRAYEKAGFLRVQEGLRSSEEIVTMALRKP